MSLGLEGTPTDGEVVAEVTAGRVTVTVSWTVVTGTPVVGLELRERTVTGGCVSAVMDLTVAAQLVDAIDTATSDATRAAMTQAPEVPPAAISTGTGGVDMASDEIMTWLQRELGGGA